MPLLTPKDVRDLVPQEDFSDDQLTITMRLVASWLREDSGRTDVSADADADPLADSDPLWGPALELVALFGENPTSLASRTAGPTSQAWPLARERDRIRARVRAMSRKATSGPRGTFPPAEPWPDPALPGRYWDPVRQAWCVAQ